MGIWLLGERRRSSLGKTKSLGKPVGIIWGKSVDSDEVILYTVLRRSVPEACERGFAAMIEANFMVLIQRGACDVPHIRFAVAY